MAKTKTKFVCQNCGYTTAKWMGRCPECGTWDSLAEELETPASGPQQSFLMPKEAPKPKTLDKVMLTEVERLKTGINEFDRVLGGGLVPGSLVLLGGDPGIGKSTMLLDAGIRFSAGGIKVLYVSGEESEAQTAMRARRLGKPGTALLVMTATDLDAVLLQAKEVQPQILVIDSIQTMYNPELQTAAGSVGQVRECTAKLLRFAKATGIAVIIIGHVTKDGNIAGPRLLEHMVDVVLQFEGDRSYSFRVLRALKNRFGSTSESGIFSMETGGLKEGANPAGLFLENRAENAPGSVVCACMEGNRPIMVEVQALVAKTPYGMPRRTAVGFDYNRVNMLLAILERRLGIDFGNFDAYLNVVGGMKITEPSADLAAAGVVIVSGGARGIDTAAHRGALAAGGITVAVLGCGIDIAYPAANKNLFAQICERGALVTEYPPGTPPAAYNFPARNRIINGMTHGILVAEAAKKSGAMITAEYALEEGHEVYCVPGSIFLPTSIGCHSLIKSGAQLVDRPEDILESLKLASFPQQPALFGSDNGEDELDDNAKAVLKILSFEPLSLEEILEKSGLGLAEAGMGLLDLEMRGKVAQTAARSYYLL